MAKETGIVKGGRKKALCFLRKPKKKISVSSEAIEGSNKVRTENVLPASGVEVTGHLRAVLLL